MEKSFRELAEEFVDRIYTFAFYSLRSREEAEDVTQEVLMKLWQHKEELNSAKSSAWVMKVTRNTLIDAARSQKSKYAVFSREVELEVAEKVAVSGSSLPDKLLYITELRDSLEKAISSTVEPYRSIIIMREIQGMKYEEIAKALEMPLNTVKVYLHRGRKMLRKALKGVL
jgi:RNA polymerase sigma factor (sigma-70 family)